MMRFFLSIVVVAALLTGVYFYLTRDQFDSHPTVDVNEVSYDQISDSTEVEKPNEDPSSSIDSGEESDEVDEISDETLDGVFTGPEQFNLAVPFTPQAPHADWSLPYGEACEEASAYMVSEYFKGTPSGKIDPDVADAAILDVVAFEDDFLGFHLDTTAEETVRFIDAYFGLQVRVIENPTVIDIKTEIAAGRPVIVPAAGRELGNPNFTGQGPLYHMFVIRGYTKDKFITNDPGTRNGEGYVYDIDVIMNAMGDWNDGDPANGEKRVIFVRP